MGKLVSIGFLAFKKFRQYIFFEMINNEFYHMIDGLEKYAKMYHKGPNFKSYKIMLECFMAIATLFLPNEIEIFRAMIENKLERLIED